MEINSFLPIDKNKLTNSSVSIKKKKVTDTSAASKNQAVADIVTISSDSLSKLQHKAAAATFDDAEIAKKELDNLKNLLLEQGAKTIMAQSSSLPQSVYDFFGIS